LARFWLVGKKWNYSAVFSKFPYVIQGCNGKNIMEHMMSSKRLALATVVVALLYSTSALLPAVPPGYVAPVWLGAGIGLFALLHYGNRLWLGVLIGSLLADIYTSLGAFEVQQFGTIFMLSASVAVGATLQAFIGASLIRRYVDIEAGLLICQYFSGQKITQHLISQPQIEEGLCSQ
jgi:hypothetical protein